MKKTLSILILNLILLSGMHLSVANHICGGKNVAIKVSFDERKASCGMKSDRELDTKTSTLKQECCHNHISDFLVDNQYQPTTNELKKTFFHLLTVSFIPLKTLLDTTQHTQKPFTSVIPPGSLSANEVSLTRICVYLI